MIKIEDLVPKHKSDISNIDKLKSISIDEVKPILIDLMEWIQDINWPVAQELIKVLPRFHAELIPIVQNIFNTDDDIWKLWTLKLVKSFPEDTMFLLKADLERLSNFPTDGEVNEEVKEIANEILLSIMH